MTPDINSPQPSYRPPPTEPLPPTVPTPPRPTIGRTRSKKPFFLTLLVLILVAGAGYGGYYFEHSRAVKTENTQQAQITALQSQVTTLTKQLSSASSTVKSSTTTSTTTQTPNSYAILSPATVASKTAECSQAITRAADGSSSPIKCTSGDLNVTEWNDIKSSYVPSVMSLGYSATSPQVQAAACSDLKSTKTTNVVEENAYQISALYYGWNFSADPVQAAIASNSC
jgi:hypothetical protein